MSSDPASLEARVRRLEDLESIRDLRKQYHVFINDGPLTGAADLFTEDGYVEFQGMGSAQGREKIRELIPALVGRLDMVKQFIHNHLIAVDGDAATGISYVDARYAYGGQSVIGAGKFVEKYRRTAQGWRIHDMRVDFYFSVPLSEGWAGEPVVHKAPVTK